MKQLAAVEPAAKPQPSSSKVIRFLRRWVFYTIAVLVAVELLHNHISYGDKVQNLLMVSLLLGILNAFVTPILKLVAPPLLNFTLNLFAFVINALLLSFLTLLLPFFHIDGFLHAFLGAIIISAVYNLLKLFWFMLNIFAFISRFFVQVRRQQPPRNSPGPSPSTGAGTGPVIDV